MGRSLRRLLEPRTIAVIGGNPALQAIRQSDRLGFDGTIWPVHPTRRSMAGNAVYRSLDELPGVPDAAFVAVNRWATVEIVHQLARIGCGGAVLHASGFAEAGTEGAELQQRLLTGHDMPLVGPNCYGTINAVNGAAMWPDVHGCCRVDNGPALISQSGNIALNLTMNNRGVDFAHVVSVGNQASVTAEEGLLYFAGRPEVTAVGLYLESINDPLEFGRAALACHETGTPVVVLKTGRTDRAGLITTSHTAALATPAASYDALFERYGVVVVDSLPEFTTTLGVVGTIGPLPGNRLVSLSCSGGEAALVADRSVHYPVVFEPFAPEHTARVRATLSDLVTITNPLDYHTFIWGDIAALEQCFTEVLTGPVDAAMLVLDWPSAGSEDTEWWPTLRGFASASATTGTRALIAAGLAENLPARIRKYATGQGLGVAYSIDEGLAGLAAAAAVGQWFASEAPPLHLPAGDPEPAESYRTIDEPSAKTLLREAGVNVPRGVVLTVADLAGGNPPIPRLRFPLVAKAVGPDHKTDLGGVITDIGTPDELATAVHRLGDRARPVLVEEQVTGGVVELLVSVRRDAPIGHVLTLGAGGTLVELLADTTTLLLPALTPVLHRALGRIRIGRRLLGSGDGPRARLDTMNSVTHRMLNLMREHPELVEIEINPLVVTSDAAWAVDALITISQ
ncbi:MAG: acetate--CoA ligase family protein [bacterium]|nr:acetate--CoA ligase family protein [bacterium]